MKHWSLHVDADGVAWATLDKPDTDINVLDREVLAEFAQVLDSFDERPPRALIIRSAKAGFIAGADIDEFDTLLDVPAVHALVARGWDLYNRLAAVPYPSCALVRGFCVGGGLELALACQRIVAIEDDSTRFGLPEVMLGIVPGWGGMLRLPQRIGAPAALDMMLTGRLVDARRARALGLVDAVAPPRLARVIARETALSGQRRRPGLVQRLLNGPLRALVAWQVRKRLASRVRREHYQAPWAILETWQHFDGNALAVPDAHPASLATLLHSPTTASLLRLFRLRERLRSAAAPAAGPWSGRHVHVIGAGVMGGDIATWCAMHGLDVTLQDQDMARIAPALTRAAASCRKKYRNDARALRATLDRIVADPQGRGLARADLVIEAVVERLDVKQAVLRDVQLRVRPDTVIASNTSSLRIEDIAAGLPEPGRLVGIHFFNPVAKMPLVEVVRSQSCAPADFERAMGFVRFIDKLPLAVRSAPGFLVNAVLAPYMFEAMRCIDEGIAPEAVDRAALDFGMAMGPVELADTVGLDVALAAGAQLIAVDQPPACLSRLVAVGKLGRKSGEGFYVWQNGQALKQPASAPEGLARRLILPLIHAAQRCVDARVVEDAALADAGVIFGAGFAPYTGGPLHALEAGRI